jgi:glycosyltransferase involved in cell wall biosynthesis
VVTTGESLRQALIRDLGLLPERVTSVPTGIDPARFAPGDKTAVRQALNLDLNRHYLGIVATLRSWKGHLYLLEAFAKLDLPDWTLLIVGEGPMLENIKGKIAGLGLQQRVIMVGQQTDPEVWMRALDIFCLPSYANEGVPQSVMQAMLTGLPIVTTPVGAILEAVSDEESALVVQPRNVEALSAAIGRLIGDEALAQRLGETAQAKAKASFSQERMLDRMEAIFSMVTR